MSTLVASGEGAALAAAFAWANARNISVIEGSVDVARSARRWFVATLASVEPLLIAARPIAARTGRPVSAILNRLRDDALPRLPVDFRAALPNDVATSALVGSLRVGASPDVWDEALRVGRERGIDALPLLAAAGRLVAPDRGPLLLFSLAASDAPSACVRAAASLAEAAPAIRVIVVADEDTYAREILVPDAHAVHLLREATVRVAAGVLATDPHVASLLTRAHDARARAANATTDSSDALDAARSAAERALHAALQAYEVTRDRFTLNGTLAVTFGNRPAEIDLLDRGSRVAVEVDGYHHFRDSEGYRRDRRKDVLLQREGFFVIRVLADDVVDRLDAIVADIASIVVTRIRRLPDGDRAV